MTWLVQLIAACVGSLGYALIFNVRRRDVLWATFGGFLSWSVFLIVKHVGGSDPICCFSAAFLLTVYAELMARVRRSPATVFLVAGAIPLFPGASLYRTVRAAVLGDWTSAVTIGKNTLFMAAAIAFGILTCTVVWRVVRLFLRKQGNHGIIEENQPFSS